MVHHKQPKKRQKPPPMFEFFTQVNNLLATGEPFVSAIIVDSIGSVPQNNGSKMLVTKDGLYFGTVGGGKIENRALEIAQEMLGDWQEKKSGAEPTRFVKVNLNKDLGMTCGGSVSLYFEIFSSDSWDITIFGAGHCSNALIETLIKLNCRITCVDPRQTWLERLPDSFNLEKICIPNMVSYVSKIPKDSYVVLMTMGHSTDSPIMIEIFKQWKERPLPYLGAIGSKAKAARLMKDIEDAGFPAEYKQKIFCPIGIQVGNNSPQEIAISVAAQLLSERDRLGGSAIEETCSGER